MAAWKLDGRIVIACNCAWGCPCNFNALPTSGKCEGGWIWAIESGRIGDVVVDAMGIALYADWPGAIHEGGGRAVCYVDERANDAQRSALTRVLRGELGGPWGLFAKTYELAQPEAATFDLRFADYDTRVRIGDAVEVELDAIRNPVTHEEVHPEMVLPEGLVVKSSKLAASRVFRLRSSIAYDHSGKYAAFGRFAYAG